MPKLMRMLVFGEEFAPPAYIPRMRYFCSYFLRKGWEIDYVVDGKGSTCHIPDGVNVRAIDYYSRKGKSFERVEWFCKFALGLVCDYKSRYFYRKSKNFWRNRRYDLVFTSSNLVFPLYAAAQAAKDLRVPLFVDLRDIPEQSPDDNYYLGRRPPRIIGKPLFAVYNKLNLYRRNRVLARAKAVTTVSPWHVETLSQYNPHTFLVYNGYDENLFHPEAVPTEYFTVSYFGRIYNELMRTPRPLFESVARLRAGGILDEKNTRLRWFVDDVSKQVVEKIAQEYGLQDMVEVRDFISPSGLQAEMARSSVLLVLCNVQSRKRFFGMMTTKFFEYVGCNRPVLCTPDNGDNLAKLVRETGCGLVSSDGAEIDSFLRERFNEWEINGHTEGHVQESIRLNFSRGYAAQTWEKLFASAVTGKLK